MNVLKKSKKWMTLKEISKILKQGTGSIGSNLNKLEKQGEVVKITRCSVFGGNKWKIKK